MWHGIRHLLVHASIHGVSVVVLGVLSPMAHPALIVRLLVSILGRVVVWSIRIVPGRVCWRRILMGIVRVLLLDRYSRGVIARHDCAGVLCCLDSRLRDVSHATYV